MIISEKIIGGRCFIFFKEDKLIPIDRIRWIDLRSIDHLTFDEMESGKFDNDFAVTIHLVNPVECFTFKKGYAEDVRKFFNSGYWKD
jgi:hypothetical protein